LCSMACNLINWHQKYHRYARQYFSKVGGPRISSANPQICGLKTSTRHTFTPSNIAYTVVR
jgi:hypothetical protein